jgi:uncharacterized protein
MSAAVEDWVGYKLDAGPGDVEAERGYVIHWCEAVEDANPLYWDEAVADELTGGWIAPPSMLSVWMRPLMFKPGDGETIRPLELHFMLKDAFQLPEGIVTGNEIEFGVPVRMGDVVATTQSVREISDERTNRLGTGRSWTIDVTYTNQRNEIVGVETYRMFSYNRPDA